MQETMNQELPPTFTEVSKTNVWLMEQGILTEGQGKTMASRANKVQEAMGDDGIDEVIAQMWLGEFNKEETRIRFGNLAFAKEVDLKGQGEDSYCLNALKTMVDNHRKRINGETKDLVKPQRNKITHETKTTVRTQETSVVPANAPSLPDASHRGPRQGVDLEEAYSRDLKKLGVLVDASSLFSMEDKAFFRRAISLLHDSRSAFELYSHL